MIEKLLFERKEDNPLKKLLLEQLNVSNREKLTAEEINKVTDKVDLIIDFLENLKKNVDELQGLHFVYEPFSKIYFLENNQRDKIAALDLKFILENIVLNSDFEFKEIPDWSEILNNQTNF